MSEKPETFEEWMKETYDHNELADIANIGCQAGQPGLIYYSETTALYDEYAYCIWELLYDDCENIGAYNNILDMLSQGRCANSVTSNQTFKNYLVWYAAETIAWRLTDGKYRHDDLEDDEAA